MSLMRKKWSIILMIAIVSTFLLIIGFNFFKMKNNKSIEELINISGLSEEFMDNYFEDIKNLNKSNNNNILIVIASSKIQETYGATKIIDAPNNKYILQYKTKKEKVNALKQLKKERGVVSVEENIKFEYADSDLESSGSVYNSWGVEAMGIDRAINSVNESNLGNVTVAIIDSGCDMELFNKYSFIHQA